MPKCNNVNCKINNGLCDEQHRCYTCHEYIHMLCGHDYYDKAGNIVENLTFPKNCFRCHEVLKDKDGGKNKSGNNKVRRQKKDRKGTTARKKASIRSSTNENEKETPTKSASPSKSNENEIQNSTRGTKKRSTRSSFDSNEKKSTENKKDSNDQDDPEVTIVNKNDIFTFTEDIELNPGYKLVGLKRGQKLMDLYSEIPPRYNSRTQVVDKIVNIPAEYWGEIGVKKDEMWWKSEIHDEELQKLSADEMKCCLLYGKVIQKTSRNNCYEVVLMSALEEVCMIHAKDVRKFLYDDGAGGKKKGSAQSSKGKRKERDGSSTVSVSNKKGKVSRRRGNQSNITPITEGDNESEEATSCNEDNIIEDDDEFESEEDLQESDVEEEESGTESERDSDEEDPDFVRIEPRTKEKRVWKIIEGHFATDYSRPITPSFVNSVRQGGWDDLSPGDIFLMQLPAQELQIWSRVTSKNLLAKKKRVTSVEEMKHFIGVLFASTQSRKVGGITKMFEFTSDGLFPASDIGKFGMNLRRFESIMNCWEFGDKEAHRGVDLEDSYWRTEQLFDRFNKHYCLIVTHGTYVNVDERVFWSYCRGQPEGTKILGRKPRGTGQEAKTLSCVDMQVTTTFEHVRGNSKKPYNRDLVKEYGKAASVVIRLCKKSGITGSNRIVIADSWFANLSCYRGLVDNGLHLIGMIKQGDGGYPKKGLCKLLNTDDYEERGSHVVAETEIDGKKVLAVAWKGKSDKGNKNKKQKFWMSTFLSSDCTTTLAGNPAEKKRHTPDGRRTTSVFVPRPQLVQDYYDGMPGTDVVNRNAQFLIGLEEGVRTRNIHKRMCCTVLGTWMANAFGMASKFYSLEKKQNMTSHSFVREVILDTLFPQKTKPPVFLSASDSGSIVSNISSRGHGGTSSISSFRPSSTQLNRRLHSTVIPSTGTPQPPPLPTVQQRVVPIGAGVISNNTHILIDQQSIDPFVHALHRCTDPVTGIQRQQRCIMCHAEGRRTNTSFYCSLCTLTASRECDRKPSKHSYCIKSEYNCFARHTAMCYQHMNKTGMMAQRENIRSNIGKGQIVSQQDIAIAGKVVSRTVPKRRAKSNRQRKKGGGRKK